jgi:aminoglycoside phosphotransferase (APT) family kinase protein
MSADAQLDKTRAVRAGEELDVPKLEAFLAREIPDVAPPIAVEQFPGGHSNLTYLVRDAKGRELVLRRPPFGNRVKTAHDMGREYKILSKLSAVYPPAPRPLAYTENPEILGSPFYVMERIRGVILRRGSPVVPSPETARKLCESFVDNLVLLHAVDPAKAGLGDLGKPEGYIARQVTGWTKRYEDAATDDIPKMNEMAKWLAAHMPADADPAIIHNDYKFDNLVLDAGDLTKIRGVLDWEMSTLGDRRMDLGTALGYWVEAGDPEEVRSFAFGPTNLPGCMTRRELVERYGAKSGLDVSNMLFYFAFSLFKTAGVAQQIYWRFKQGLTKDERFGAFIFGVRVLSAAAVQAVARGTI